MDTEAMVTLYLEPWQQRMMKDFSKLKLASKVTIKPGKGGCPSSYKIPVDGMKRDDWLIYLTDQQMLQVKEALKLRTAIYSINVTADAMKNGTVKFS